MAELPKSCMECKHAEKKRNHEMAPDYYDCAHPDRPYVLVCGHEQIPDNCPLRKEAKP